MPGLANLALDLGESDSRQRSGSIGEATVDDARVQSENVELTGAAIAVHNRDSHLRHHLGQPRIESLEHLLLCDFGIGSGRRERTTGLKRQPWTDGSRTIADQHRGVMDVAAIAGLYRNAGQGSQPSGNKSLMNGIR